MTTRKLYSEVAEVLATMRRDHSLNNAVLWAVTEFTTKLADTFASDNPRFDRQKFLRAAGLKEEDQ